MEKIILKKYLIFLGFAFLIFLSFIPRSVEIFNKNYIFLLDQGRDYLAVRDIVINRNLTLIGSEFGGGMAGFQGLFHGPFHFYLLSIPFIVFDGNPYGGLLLMFVFGLLTIMMGFFLGRKVLGGIFGGLSMAFLIALSPPLIAQSRFVWNPHPASFFILVAFYFIYLAFKKNRKYLFLAAFFTGFIYNFESAIAVPMVLSFVVYAVFLLRPKLRDLIFVFLGFITSYLPFILFEVRHNFAATWGIIRYISHSAGNLKFDLNAFLRNFIDTFPQQGVIPINLIMLIFLAALVFFAVTENKKEIRYFIFFLFILTVITFATLSIVRTYIFEYYIIHLNFIYIFLFSYFLISSYKKNQIKLFILFATFFSIFVLSGTLNGIKTFLKDYADYGGMVKIRGKVDAIDYIYKDARGEKFGLLVFSPPIYTYPYDYLIWWYGQKNYHYVPHQEKQGLFYLLIEKDVVMPWTYKGWLETVIKTGKVIKTWQLPSGFIIQKRMGDKNVTSYR